MGQHYERYEDVRVSTFMEKVLHNTLNGPYVYMIFSSLRNTRSRIFSPRYV